MRPHRILSYIVPALALSLLAGAGCDRKRTTQPGAPTPAPPGQVAQPSAELDGTWKAVAVEFDGQQMPPAQVEAMIPGVVEFSGNKMVTKIGPRVVTEATITTDPTRQPKTIDIHGTVLAGRQAGQSGDGIGIYEVAGDTLKVCVIPGGKQRPQALQTPPGTGAELTTYRRVR